MPLQKIRRHTGKQTHPHLEAICVSPFHLSCMSLGRGRKPTHGEHETCWHWHLTWAAVVESKCISPPALCTFTLSLSTAPSHCHAAAWSCLSPVHLWWKYIFLFCFFFPHKGIYLHFETRCSFRKISHNHDEIHKRELNLLQAVRHIFSCIWSKCLTHLNCICAAIQIFMDFRQVINSIFVLFVSSSWCLAQWTAHTL